MNTPIPIGGNDGGGVIKDVSFITTTFTTKEYSVTWGNTIELEFHVEVDLTYRQDPPFPPAFAPPIPQGHFYPGDQVGFRTAQEVYAIVTIVYMAYTDNPQVCASNTVIINVGPAGEQTPSPHTPKAST
jgi:hypothetical protein